jgi:hypothetical protein
MWASKAIVWPAGSPLSSKAVVPLSRTSPGTLSATPSCRFGESPADVRGVVATPDTRLPAKEAKPAEASTAPGEHLSISSIKFLFLLLDKTDSTGFKTKLSHPVDLPGRFGSQLGHSLIRDIRNNVFVPSSVPDKLRVELQVILLHKVG